MSAHLTKESAPQLYRRSGGGRQIVPSSSQSDVDGSDNGWLVEECKNGSEQTTQCEEGLTLMEEFLLLSHEKISRSHHFVAGALSFMKEANLDGVIDSSILLGLGRCILLELWLQDRIGVKINPKSKIGNKEASLKFKVMLINARKTGDEILDEVLKQVQDTKKPLSVGDWVDHLCGYKTNATNIPYKIKNICERVTNSLVAKGALSTESSFMFFNLTPRPIVNQEQRHQVIKKVQSLLLGWERKVRIKPRVLCLVLMSFYANSIDVALEALNENDSLLARKRIVAFSELYLKGMAQKANTLMWIMFQNAFEFRQKNADNK